MPLHSSVERISCLHAERRRMSLLPFSMSMSWQGESGTMLLSWSNRIGVIGVSALSLAKASEPWC